MKKILEKVLSFFFRYFWFICIGIVMLNFFLIILPNSKKNEKLADGFTIEKYHVDLEVNEDNKVFVQEDITVDWYEENHHGIYKLTPQWLEYTGQDEKTIKRKSIITDLIAKEEPYSVSWVNKKAQIQIGDPDQTVSTGEKEYQISYTYDMGKDPFEGFDEFIFHAFGDYWGTEIKNASMTIHMPKAIDENNIHFFTDKKRKEDVTEFVDYFVLQDTLYATFNHEKYKQQNQTLENALTVDIELPEGYFVGGSWNYGWISFTISMIVFLLTIYTIIQWLRHGKDRSKKVATVEFYPPENFCSAEVGYLYNKHSTKKLTISLIVQLASKGYLKIDEIGKNKIQITNLVHKPKALAKFEDTLPQRVIRIKKQKPEDENLSMSATSMMVHLFKEGDVIDLTFNFDKFMDVKEELLRGGYIEILEDNYDEQHEALRKEEYQKQSAHYQKEFARYQQKVSEYPLSEYEQTVYDRLFEIGDVFLMEDHTTFYKTFDQIDRLLDTNLRDKVIDKKSRKQRNLSIVITILVFLLSMISYFGVKDLDPTWNFLYLLSFGCFFIHVFFTLIMERKTNYGEELYAKILGFKDFLIKVEKPKLEQLVAQNPKYFYDILPYTYILNVSKTWIKKFENIPMEKMDLGSFDFFDDACLSNLYHDIYVPSSSGGGFFSGGGGCSSCGGGGSW